MKNYRQVGRVVLSFAVYVCKSKLNSSQQRNFPSAARAACLFWSRHFALYLRLGESEVSVCGPAGNPQASVVFAFLPHTHTQARSQFGTPPVCECGTLL